MTIKKKTKDTTTRSEKEPKPIPYVFTGIDTIYPWRQSPPSEKYLAQLGKELIRWTQAELKEGSRRVSLSRFYNERFLLKETVNTWRKKHQFFGDCVNIAKQMMGAKLEEGMIHKEFSEKAVMRLMPFYDSDYKEIDNYQAELQAKNPSQSLTLLGSIFKPPELSGENRQSEKSEQAEESETNSI